MDNFKSRKYIIVGIFIAIPFIFLIKLASIQIFDKSYRKLANDNVIREIINYPTRGLIYDRNNELIVYNEATYDLMVVPANTSKDLDLSHLSTFLKVERSELEAALAKAKSYSRYKPSVVVKQISAAMYAHFQEHLYKFPGFYTQTRTLRKYPHQAAAHILGYIGEVNEKQIEASNKYYQPGDYIGINGLESSYERILRGTRGKKYVFVDVHGRVQGDFHGEYVQSLDPIAGNNIYSTIDIKLQMFGEKLMQNKKGSIVAIEPTTGEILAMVSSPAYDPNLLSGASKGVNFKILSQDKLIPLYNRPIMAQYSPGSVFKTIMGIIGLEEGVITDRTIYHSRGAYYSRGLRVGDHAPPGLYNVTKAIQLSSNAYFCDLFEKILNQKKYGSVEQAFIQWKSYLDAYGMGQKLGIDIPNEVKGLTPSNEYYNKIYGKGRWKAPTIISLSIGQGELLVTPLQLSNLMVVLATRGYYITPHLVSDVAQNDTKLKLRLQKHQLPISQDNFDIVINAMEDVVTQGTARIAKIDDIIICGKTGTVENPHGEDHSIFAAFAPKDNPQIAIAVVVENSGYGSTWAAPIASLMIEKYLTDSIRTNRLWLRDRILKANLINPDSET